MDEMKECKIEKVKDINKLEAKKYLGLGIKAQEKCNLKEALVLFEKATKIDPNCTDAWKYKAEILELLGKRKEAEKCYEWLLGYCHKDFKTLRENAALYSCTLLPRTKNKKEKLKRELVIVGELVEKHPRSVELRLIEIDVVSYLVGKTEVLELIDKVLHRFPQSRKVWQKKYHLLSLYGKSPQSLQPRNKKENAYEN